MQKVAGVAGVAPALAPGSGPGSGPMKLLSPRYETNTPAYDWKIVPTPTPNPTPEPVPKPVPEPAPEPSAPIQPTIQPPAVRLQETIQSHDAPVPVKMMPLVTAPAPPKTRSPAMAWIQKWWIAVLVGLLLLLLLLYMVSRRGKGQEQGKSDTRQIFPIGSKVAIQSVNSGKFLCFQEAKDALTNQQHSPSGLVLEATGTSASEPSCQWQVMDLTPDQPPELQGIAIRLKNIQFESFFREMETSTNVVFQVGTGARAFSPLLATSTPQGILIIGAALFARSGQAKLEPTNPFLLQSNNQGVIGTTQNASHTPSANSPFWHVHYL